MPTELTVSPFRIYQQLPIALEHPVPFDKMFGGPKAAPAHHYATGAVPGMRPHHVHGSPGMSHLQPFSHLPMAGVVQGMPGGSSASMRVADMSRTIQSGMPHTGPARMAECMPNKSMPSGMKNPWAVYSGETYVPNSHKVAAIDYKRAMSIYDTGDGVPMSVHAPSNGGIGGVRRGSAASWSQQSFSDAASAPMMLQEAAQHASDAGWNVRHHRGHHPDPGATGRRSSISISDLDSFGQTLNHSHSQAGLAPGPGTLQNNVSRSGTQLCSQGARLMPNGDPNDITRGFDGYSMSVPRRPSMSGSGRTSVSHTGHRQDMQIYSRGRRASHSCCHAA